jgi:hypothetical protein
MKADNAISSFWQSYTVAEKSTKLLTGKTESLAPGPMAVAVHADESPDSAMLEVVEYHQ